MKRHLSFVAASGIFFFALHATVHAQVKADPGGVAIGGSVSGSTINIGIAQEKVDALVRDARRPLEELTAQQRENIALLKEKLDLNERQVRAALGILGENDIPPEQLAAKLVEIAESFKALKATALAQPGEDPKIAALKTDAQKAIEAGDLAKADALLAEAQAEQTRSLDELAVNAADTFSRRGEIALTRLRYAEAAKYFANAAAVFPPQSTYDNRRISYLQKEAYALIQQGYEFGDNGALLSAIELRKRLVELLPRERVPLEWAGAQNNLGFALWALGERESGTANLEEAVATFREALTEQTRERAPLGWAGTQVGLGTALQALGWRESGTSKLQEAIVAYRKALKEFTRERVPLRWAATQDNLGNALKKLGARESDTARLDEAVAAYREALKEFTRERAPLEWARAQHNLGSALVALGVRESGTAKLEEAVIAYREALKGKPRERVPLRWARSFGDEGVALMLLAERRGDAAMAETALSQINAALETLRDGGDAPYAASYERQLPRARAIVARLRLE
jgi:tetratricopeptide (TPR) repeat protein